MYNQFAVAIQLYLSINIVSLPLYYSLSLYSFVTVHPNYLVFGVHVTGHGLVKFNLITNRLISPQLAIPWERFLEKVPKIDFL